MRNVSFGLQSPVPRARFLPAAQGSLIPLLRRLWAGARVLPRRERIVLAGRERSSASRHYPREREEASSVRANSYTDPPNTSALPPITSSQAGQEIVGLGPKGEQSEC